MQNELKPGRLLDIKGNLIEAGYAKSLVKDYNRKDIKAGKLRIKEWDYYYIGNNDFGIALTIADNSYMGLYSVSILDYRSKWDHTRSVMSLFPLGKTNLAPSSKSGDVFYHNKRIKIEFFNDGSSRHLLCEFKNFYKKQDFKCEIELYDEGNESMVIATPFDKPKHFYYNQKINCLRAKGKASVGEAIYNLDNAYGVLDWGRGVWTYKNTWYWSSMSGLVDNKRVGFNLGYGFGDTSKASENMFFYDGKAYKLDKVTFNIPINKKGKEEYLAKWTFTSNDNKLYLEFTPILDRYANSNAIIIQSLQHQVFGTFKGYVKINDEKMIEINNMIGFAEKVMNRW